MAIWFYDMAQPGNWNGSKVQIGSVGETQKWYSSSSTILDSLFYGQGGWQEVTIGLAENKKKYFPLEILGLIYMQVVN